MAISPILQYPGKVAPVTGAYPYGGAQNITAPGDGTGTPWEAALLNDVFGLQQALLKSAAIVPSGTPDAVGASEYFQSLIELAMGRAIQYDETGITGAYILSAKTGQQVPSAYFVGQTVEFLPTFGNFAGPSTIKFTGLATKNIVDVKGNALTAGEFLPTDRVKLRYDGVNFVLIREGRIIHAQTTSISSSLSEYSLSGMLPTDIKRIVITINNIGATANAAFVIKGKVGSIVTNGYAGYCSRISGTVVTAQSTAGYTIKEAGGSPSLLSGVVTLTRLGISNVWCSTSTLTNTSFGFNHIAAGIKTFTGGLNGVAISTVSGGVFNSGSVDVTYEF